MKKLYLVSAILLLGVGTVTYTNDAISAINIFKTESVKAATKKSLIDNYNAYATKSGLPTDGIQSVKLKSHTLTIKFTYDGQFGTFMQTLRKGNTVDKRLKKYFKKHNVKTVVLKSDSGNMILSSRYGVNFKS